MKTTILLAGSLLFATASFAQSDSAMDIAELQAAIQRIDSIEKSFVYQHGTIQLKNGIATVKVPDGFKYLDAEQAKHVLTDLWGNPEDDKSMGLILPEAGGVMQQESWAFNIEYDEMGYVEDDDAEDIDYDEMLEQMKKDAGDANAQRQTLGYDPITIVGWAAAPFYDKERKILHWAKELKFGDADYNTLNYNVRVLGRQGVLELNAIGSMDQFPEINKQVPKVLDIVEFTEGNKYADFNPDVDKVAAWTVGGLVAGKVLAKAGLFVILAKFWKLIIIGIGAGGAFIWSKIRRRKEEPADNQG
jgi:uncharacterized membrane-anchored protein